MNFFSKQLRIIKVIVAILVSIAIELIIFIAWASVGFGCGIDMLGFYNWHYRNDFCTFFQYSGVLLLIFPLSFLLPIKKDKYFKIIVAFAIITLLYALWASQLQFEL